MRKNVASQNISGMMVSATTGAPLTSAVSVFVTGDGGTQNAGGGTTTHKGNGQWNYAPTQAETNFNHIAFTFTHASGVNQVVNVYTVSFDPHDTVRQGLTALPNAAAGGAAGLPIVGTGTNNFKSDASANVTFANTSIATVTSVTNDVGITQAGADKVWGTTTRLLTAGTNIVLAKGVGVTGFNDITAAQAATGVWQDAVAGDFTVTNSIGKNLKAGDTVPGGASGHFIAGSNAATSITTALTANITGNLSGSVGSVTGAVTVGTNNDKTGYSLVQAFPANFATLSISGTGVVEANAVQIDGNATTLGNFRDTYNGLGYSNSFAPATQAAVAALSAGSSTINVGALSRNLVVGTEVNTFTETLGADGVSHELSDVAGALDVQYDFDVTPIGVPVQASFVIRGTSNNDNWIIQARNFTGAGSWEQIGIVTGKSPTTFDSVTATLFQRHVGSGADLGKVRLRFIENGALTSSTLFIDQMVVSYVVIDSDILRTAQATGGGSDYIDLDAGASAIDDFYKPVLVIIKAGTGTGQSRRGESYTASPNKRLFVATPWKTIPDATSLFELRPWASVRVSENDPDVITAGSIATSGANKIRDAIMPPKNVAYNDVEFLMVDGIDHITPKTGLTITATRSIDGGAFGAKDAATIVAEVGNGIYQIDIAAADMNGKIITWRFSAVGADETYLTIVTGG